MFSSLFIEGGLFSLALADSVRACLCIGADLNSDQGLQSFGEENAKANGISNVSFIMGLPRKVGVLTSQNLTSEPPICFDTKKNERNYWRTVRLLVIIIINVGSCWLTRTSNSTALGRRTRRLTTLAMFPSSWVRPARLVFNIDNHDVYYQPCCFVFINFYQQLNSFGEENAKANNISNVSFIMGAPSKVGFWDMVNFLFNSG